MKRILCALVMSLSALSWGQIVGPGSGGGGGGSGTVTSITTGYGLTGGTITATGTVALANPLNGVLTVDGTDHTSSGGANTTNLCTTLAFIATAAAAHTDTYWQIYDNTPERGANAWTKDPFNDATCGAGATGYTLYMGLGTWMTNWPSIQIPSGVDVEMLTRASENQVATANVQSGTLLIACNASAPWTSTFAMSCPGGTNYPGAVISTIVRASNVVTVTTSSPHLYTSAMASANPPVLIDIANTTGGTTTCNGMYALASVPDSTHLTYAETGADESCTASGGTVGSPVMVLGNSGVGNNDFGAVLHNGTISAAGITGSIGVGNITCQERCLMDQVTIVGWQTYCIDNQRSQSQNFDFDHIECLSGSKTGATIGTPVTAVCVKWQVNGPSRGFNAITCNPRGAATVAPILADILLSGTQGGTFNAEHMENAQYQYLVTAAPTGVVTRDTIITTTNTGSVLQGQTVSTIARSGNTVTVTAPAATGAITGEKVTISGSAGTSVLTLTSVNGAGVYQGTITGGSANALVGAVYNITGFTNSANNLVDATVTASTTTALTFSATTTIETHAGTATSSFDGTFSSITRTGATTFTYSQTAANDSGTTGTETLGGMATIHMCGTTSTINGCQTGGNTVRNTVIGSVRISPSLVVNAVEDDTSNAGAGRTISAGSWSGAYFQAQPDFGGALNPINGGSGLISPTAHSVLNAEGPSAYNLTTSPSVNGFYTCGFNVTASAAVDLGCALAGVPVTANSTSYALLYSDRASYEKISGGTTATLTLAQITGNFASNYPFVTGNFNSGNVTFQANAADKINNSATGGTLTLIPNFASLMYQDSSSAPGNWWPIRFPMFEAFPACADTSGNHLNFATATGFSCGTSSSTTALAESAITGSAAATTITETGASFSITRAGVATANLTAPQVFVNTNSSNNNTSITMGVSSPGTSTGQTTLNVNGASTGGDLADFGTGGTWTAGVLSGQTIVGSVLIGGAYQAKGSTAGFVALSQGSTSSAVAPCNAANTHCIQAPAAVTASLETDAPAQAQGIPTRTGVAATIQDGYSGDANHSATVTIGSGSSIGSTSLCSTAICLVGTYRVNVYVDITTACGTTGTYVVNLIYTDDQGSKTIPVNINGTGAVPATGVLTTTSTANFGEASQILRSTGAASINYSTTAAACGTAGPMVGKLYLSVEPVQ